MLHAADSTNQLGTDPSTVWTDNLKEGGSSCPITSIARSLVKISVSTSLTAMYSRRNRHRVCNQRLPLHLRPIVRRQHREGITNKIILNGDLVEAVTNPATNSRTEKNGVQHRPRSRIGVRSFPSNGCTCAATGLTSETHQYEAMPSVWTGRPSCHRPNVAVSLGSPLPRYHH